MNDSGFFEVGSEGILDGFAGVFFSAVSMEKLEFVAGLSFDHCEPAFEDFEYCIRLFVGDCVHPGVICSEVVEGEDIFCIAKRDWIDLTTNIRGNAEEREFRFIRDGDREGATSLFAENAEVAIFGVEFDSEFAETFFRRMKKSIVDGEPISAVLDELLLFLLGLRWCRRVV